MKKYKVELVSDISEITQFISDWHYSHSVSGVDCRYCFALYDDKELVGAAIYGYPATPNSWKKFGDERNDVIELRRLYLLDEEPRNAESWFVSRTLHWLVKNTIHKTVISYSDPHYGHVGTIYRASNFTFEGMTKPSEVILWDGRTYHRRSLNTKTSAGALTPNAARLRYALDKREACFKFMPPKYLYSYNLESRR